METGKSKALELFCVAVTGLASALCSAGPVKIPPYDGVALPAHGEEMRAYLPEHARIVKAQDRAAADGVRECPLALPSEIDLPADWPVVSNAVYVTDLYIMACQGVKALNPYARFTVPAALPKKPSLPLETWDRMPSGNVTVLCTSGKADEPPPEFFLRRGYRVRLDGKDLPVETAPCAGMRVVLELPPTPKNPRNSEGSFLRLKDGTLLFAWSRYYEAGLVENASWDNGGADIAFRRSPDNGETWSDKDGILVKNDAMNVMSPSFLRLQDGRIALFYVRKINAKIDGIMMRTSSDEAKSWSTPVDVTAPVMQSWYVLNNDRVIQLRSGRLVVPLARHDPKEDDGVSGMATDLCMLSDDGGATWRAGATVRVWTPDGRRVSMQEPGVVELKDGRVMMWARTNVGAQYVGYSSDGGETWGAFGPSDMVGPQSPASIRRLASGALLGIWNDHREHPELSPYGRRAPLSFAVSQDEGKTWPKSATIEADLTGFHCYTAVYERPDGLLLAYCCKLNRNLDRTRMTFVPKKGF